MTVPADFASRVSLLRRLIAFSPLVVVWTLFFKQTSFFWGVEGYYFFGWLTPPLALFFLWQKVRTAPEPASPPQANAVVAVVGGAMAVVFLLAYGMHETMPFWRTLVFTMAGTALLFSVVWVWALGGDPWSRHFLSLFLIMLICLPWPSGWEGTIVFHLTMAVTQATEWMLNFLGYAATSTGNRIDVLGHAVEVGDACSGIRSFQGLVMVGVVIGELYRFRWNRITLLLSAFFISFPLNIFRALILSLIVVESGQEGYEAWHDPLGAIVYVIGCSSLLALGFIMRAKDEDLPEPPGAAHTLGMARVVAVAWAGVFLTVALLLEWHFSHHSALDAERGKRLWVSDAASGHNGLRARRLSLSDEVLDTLQFDEGTHHEVYSVAGDRFEFFDFYYASGIMGILAAEHHTPEVCMGKYGGRQVVAKEFGRSLEIGGVKVPVVGYSLEGRREDRINAFQGIWIAGDEGTPWDRYNELVVSVGADRWGRLGVAWRRLVEGQREFSVQVFLIVILGPTDLNDAWERTEPILESVIKVPASIQPSGGAA